MKKTRPSVAEVREWARQFNLEDSWTVSTYCSRREGAATRHSRCQGRANNFGKRVKCGCECHEQEHG